MNVNLGLLNLLSLHCDFSLYDDINNSFFLFVWNFSILVSARDSVTVIILTMMSRERNVCYQIIFVFDHYSSFFICCCLAFYFGRFSITHFFYFFGLIFGCMGMRLFLDLSSLIPYLDFIGYLYSSVVIQWLCSSHLLHSFIFSVSFRDIHLVTILYGQHFVEFLVELEHSLNSFSLLVLVTESNSLLALMCTFFFIGFQLVHLLAFLNSNCDLCACCFFSLLFFFKCLLKMARFA